MKISLELCFSDLNRNNVYINLLLEKDTVLLSDYWPEVSLKIVSHGPDSSCELHNLQCNVDNILIRTEMQADIYGFLFSSSHGVQNCQLFHIYRSAVILRH